MKIKYVLEKFVYITAVGISIFLLLFIIACTWIGYEVKNECRSAGGNCVDSLTKLLDDEQRDFRSRNKAIWALGQLGDKRALPVLQKYYTGNIPSREPLDKMISQYELKKAINLVSGGLNITAVFWRNSAILE